MVEGKPQEVDTMFTRKEEKILKLLANVSTDQEICEELSITKGTLANHFQNIQRKLMLYGRRKELLVRYAIDHGYGSRVTA